MDDLWNYVCTGCLLSRHEHGAAVNIITEHTHITEQSCAYCTTQGLSRKCTEDKDASSLKPYLGERLHSVTNEQSTFDDIRATLALNC